MARKAVEMTGNETFKRRIRERMASTGERYTAARRPLIEQSADQGGRVWISQPELSDEAIRNSTGRGWDDWCDIIDASPVRTEGHTAIAALVRDDLGVDAWWAQTVAVGYERISGLRLPHQRPDGTFTADKSKTIPIEADRLRKLLLDEGDRADLLGGEQTELRSRPTSRAIRLAIGPGVALITLQAKSEGTTVVVAHERLPDLDEVAKWKFFWGEWLTALADI